MRPASYGWNDRADELLRSVVSLTQISIFHALAAAYAQHGLNGANPAEAAEVRCLPQSAGLRSDDSSTDFYSPRCFPRSSPRLWPVDRLPRPSRRPTHPPHLPRRPFPHRRRLRNLGFIQTQSNHSRRPSQGTASPCCQMVSLAYSPPPYGQLTPCTGSPSSIPFPSPSTP